MVPIHAEKSIEGSLHDPAVARELPVRGADRDRSPVAACGPRQHPWKITHALVLARPLRAGTARAPNLIGSWSQCMRKSERRLSMNLQEYVLLAVSSLFVIIDPIATVPAVLAMTSTDTPQQRIRMARLACLVTSGLLLAFAIGGKWIFQFLGVTIPVFQMAGSVVLLLVALDMLRAQRSRVHETAEETDAGAAKDDIAVTPLAVPMLAGPGAISTVVILHSRAANLTQQIALLFCILVVCGACY